MQEHQIKVMNHLSKQKNRGLVAYHGLGSGKTLTSIATAEQIMNTYDVTTTVVCPASLRSNYRKELKKWGRDASRYDIHSFESFLRKDPKICSKTFLVIDEAHRIRNGRLLKKKENITSKIQKCSQKAFKVLLLTGTPVHNHPADVLPLIDTINKKLTVGKSMNNIRKKFNISDTKCKFSYYDNRDSEHYPTVTNKSVFLTMTEKQYQVYKQFEEENLSSEIEQVLLSTMNISNLSGLKYFLNGSRRLCNIVDNISPKIKHIWDFIKNNSGKHVVYSNYKMHGLHILTRLLDKYDIDHGLFTGSVSQKDRDEVLRDYNNGNIKILLISSAGAEGLDLKKTKYVHILEPHWNDEKINQVIGRAVRYDSHKGSKDKSVTVYKYFMRKPNEPILTDKEIKITSSMPKTVKNMLRSENIKLFDKHFLASVTNDPFIMPAIDLYLKNISHYKTKLNENFKKNLIKFSIEKNKC